MSSAATSRGIRSPATSRLKDLLRRIRPILLWAGALSFFVNLLTFSGTIFMLQVYDRVLTSRNETTLVMLAAIACALLAAYAVLDYLRTRLLIQAGEALDRAMAGPAFQVALTEAIENPGSGNVQIVRDAEMLREFLSGGAFVTVLDAPWVPVWVAVCFAFHPWLGWATVAGGLVLFATALVNETMTRPHIIAAARLGLEATNQLASHLRNAEAVRGLGMGRQVEGRWRDKAREALQRSIAASNRGGGLLAASKYARQVMNIAILGLGAYLVLRGEITAGVMFASSLMVAKALAPIEQAVAQWRAVVTARIALRRLDAAFAALPPADRRTELPRPKGALTLEHVTVFAPKTEIPVLKNISFTLPAGEVLALVGPTGSGKSSLARTIVGVWSPRAGAVRLDGSDLRHYPVEQTSRFVGYLPQDVELFDGTVADNIARFRADGGQAAVAAAVAAHAHEMIQRLPGGYDTRVGEDGHALSGGQRQRVGLARAIYGEPCLVVLDEPNANLDGEGEEALLRTIQALKARGVTVVVVTHRTNFVAAVDKILVLADGQIRHYGPPSEVLPKIAPPNLVAKLGQARPGALRRAAGAGDQPVREG